ncbi:hypothetical protein PINS_up012297 [Pythium insidiosum]|nr:hypothetical protein PINS_up012297 [Pythium insidiosum]
MRLLQELEMAFQFCAQQMLQAQQSSAEQQAALFMFLPQFEFMERVKALHADLERVYNTSVNDATDGRGKGDDDDDDDPQQRLADAWRAFDVRAEMTSALERNQRLQRQLEFLSRSLVYDVQHDGDAPSRTKLQRTATDASATTSDGPSEGESSANLGSSNGPAPVRNLTEQLNALERENYVLKGKLEAALASVHALETRSEVADTTSSTGRSSLDLTPAAMASLAPAIDENESENAVLEELAQLRDDRQALQEQVEQMRAELEALREANATTAAAPANKATSPRSGLASSRVSTNSGGGGSAMGSDFLNKIYMDVGKAKIALEEKVKRLQQELTTTREDNAKLQNELLLLAHQQATASAAAAASASSSPPTESRFEEIHDDDDSGKDDEKDLAQWQELAQEREARVKVLDQELEFMRQHLTEKATQVTTLETELATLRTTLATAQKKVTALEIRIEALEVENRELQERVESTAALANPYGGSNSVSSLGLRESSTARDDEVVELTKQLKLARQEVMQLRYRSNNLESVHEKLEEALKEKKTLQVKLTTLEGQLYEQRSRTISGSNFTAAPTAATTATYDAAMIEELQRQLDQKSAQLLIAQREAETLRREVTTPNNNSNSDATLVDLEARVQRFSTELARLTERNDDQATRIHALSERVEKVTREKYELEGLMKELLREIDGEMVADIDEEPPKPKPLPEPLDMSVLPPPRRPSDMEIPRPSPSTAALQAPASIPAPTAAPTTSGRVLDRYTTAIRSSAGSTPTTPSGGDPPVAPTRVVPKNRVASLIRNFSSASAASSTTATRVEVVDVAESETDATTEDETEMVTITTSPARRSTLGSAMKRVRKLDFRARQGSAPAPPSE